ncbi:hypothetical protein ACMZ89_03095 [Gardnerella vaginalis]|uniref:hypothetical protein n=1 Tax=Gardnerella vaginalis TaxID=2702 RepID=UPI0039EF9ADD
MTVAVVPVVIKVLIQLMPLVTIQTVLVVVRTFPLNIQKMNIKKPAVTAKMFAITGFAIKDFILFDLLG